MQFLSAKFWRASVLVLCCALVSSVIAEETITKIFYDQLTAERATVAARVPLLVSFIKDHPQFEPAYLKLAEYAQCDSSKESALFALKHFAAHREEFPHADHALANALAHEVPPDSVNKIYLQALNSPTPSFALINDYVQFDNEHQHRYSATKQILDSSASPAAQSFAIAIDHFHDENFSRAEKALRNINAPDHELLLNYYLASTEVNQSNLKSAEATANRCLALAEQIGDVPTRAALQLLRFNISWRQHQSNQARRFLARADSLVALLDDIPLRNRVELQKSYLLQIDGNYKTAETSYKAVARNFEALHDSKRAARAYSAAANAAYTISRYSQALDLALKSFSLYEKSGDHFEIIGVLNLISKIYAEFDHIEISEMYLNKAYTIAKRHNYREKLIDLQISTLKLKARKSPPQKAIAIYSELLHKYSQSNSQVNPQYCNCMIAAKYERLADWKHAEEYYRHALEGAHSKNDAYLAGWALYGALRMRSKRNSPLTVSDYNNLIAAASEENDRVLEAAALIALGDFYHKRDNIDKCINSYQQSIQIHESMRDSLKAPAFRIGYMSQSEGGYNRLSEIYAELFQKSPHPSYLQNIFKYEEMHHSRVLKDVLKRKNSIESNLPDGDYVDAILQLQNQQIKLREAKNLNQSDIEQLLSSIVAGKYRVVTERINIAHRQTTDTDHSGYAPRELDQVQRTLGDATILLYHSTSRKSFVMAINKDNADIIPLEIDLQKLKTQIDSLIAPMHGVTAQNLSKIPFNAAIAHQLYRQIFEPVRTSFPLHEKIVILPTGAIAQLPFEMLLHDPPAKASYTPTEKPDYAEGFLVHDFTFFYGPNTAELIRTKKRSRKPTILVAADPFRDDEPPSNEFMLRYRTGWHLTPLPYAQLEADRITYQWPDTKVYSGPDATEDVLKNEAGQFDILHVATHAFMDTLFEDFSGLALARESGSPEDGLLQGYEIQAGNYANDLIVLSACESGRGKQISGEGVLALPRQFLIAGAHSVLMSLWKVDDRFTSIIMPHFYEELLQKGHSKAAALRRSKIFVLKNNLQHNGNYYSHPVFWASFNLYGDPGVELKNTTRYVIILLLVSAIALVVLRISLKRRSSTA